MIMRIMDVGNDNYLGSSTHSNKRRVCKNNNNEEANYDNDTNKVIKIRKL